MRSYLWFFGITAWLLTFVPAFGLALLLLFSAITLRGILFAIAVILIWIGIPFLRSEKRSRAIACLTLVGLGSIVWIGLGSTAPYSPGASDSKFRSVYEGTARFKKRSLAQIVPESDQLLMGAKLFPALDPFLDKAKASKLSQHLESIYTEMDDDTEFKTCESALGICYREIFTSRQESGHRFEYIPKSNGEPMPAILFLHGSMGNFKAYQWILKSLADQHGLAVISPSHGHGEWRNEGGMREIQAGLQACLNHPEIDPDQIYLAGLSNGGAGVTMALPQIADQIAGLIYLSPVLEPAAAQSPKFLEAIKGKPVLLLSGSKDQRIPEEMLKAAISTIEPVTDIDVRFFEDQDHFLFFDQRSQICELISQWLASRKTG